MWVRALQVVSVLVGIVALVRDRVRFLAAAVATPLRRTGAESEAGPRTSLAGSAR